MPKAGTAPRPTEDVVDAEVVEDIGELTQPSTELATIDSLDELFVSYDETEEHLNILYWGREGSGKTIDIAAATQLGKVLFVNAEGGLKKQALLANGVNTSNLVIFPRPGQELSYHTLEAAIFKIKSDLMDDPSSWFLFAIDSVTELATAFTEAASDDNFAKAKRKNQAWKPGINDEFFTDRSDFGTSTKMVRKLVRMLRDAPIHVAMTALERRDVDEDTSKVAYGPAMGPALQTSLLGYVDVVLYCKAADDDRPYFRAQTKKVGTARAKDRIGILPKILVDPTIPRILAYNEGVLTEDTDPLQAVLLQGADETAPAAKKKAPGRPGARKTTPSAPAGSKTAGDTTEGAEG
jgi:hypothetical protein